MPMAAGAEHIVDGVDHLPHVGGTVPATGFARRDERFQLLPLGVGQVGGVGFAVHRLSSTLPPNFSYQLLASPRLAVGAAIVLLALGAHPAQKRIISSAPPDTEPKADYRFYTACA
jgi:hypothetical protein